MKLPEITLQYLNAKRFKKSILKITKINKDAKEADEKILKIIKNW